MEGQKIHVNFSDLFSEAFNVYKKNWIKIFLLGVIFFIFAIAMASVDIIIVASSPFYFILKILVWLVWMYVWIGITRYMLRLFDGVEVKLHEIFHGVDSIKHFIFILLVLIITKLIILFGIILFIIPGIIASLGLIFAKYVIIENKGGNVGVFNAIKQSWKITKGYKWRLFGLVAVLSLFNIMGILLLIVGLIVTLPVSYFVMIAAYRKLSQNNVKELDINTQDELVDNKVVV